MGQMKMFFFKVRKNLENIELEKGFLVEGTDWDLGAPQRAFGGENSEFRKRKSHDKNGGEALKVF